MSKRSRRRHSSVRDLFDAGVDPATSPFDGLEDDERAGDDDEPADEAPRVVLGTLADFGSDVPAIVGRFPDRPVWFLVDEHDPSVGLFERYPEEPFPNAVTAAILSFLRDFSTANDAALQALLGSTDRLRFGFHTSAAIEDVVMSFEDDGFDVLLGLADGGVLLPDDV